ncbi:nicotinate mononucleotide-dependent phosphoribosyltransferase CobT [Sulfurospirillum arcachonense]|uniref:nicotinate mononucleotide-dependent phosphoribosyltransferase CobT n=1 Tax=Sulfurospirillum arcachonense TaxID=57666 RepID=UPI0004682946|nr:TIGR00303 family protein [Sulfurospirillum arcachonense]
MKNIVGSIDFMENLRGKSASFMLAMSTTKTYEIEGLSQAGLPGLIHLTPTLDAEFICTGQVKSLQCVPETLKGIPTPGLMTRAVHMLKPFKQIEILDLGVHTSPDLDCFNQYTFGIKPSDRIDTGANIDAKSVFEKGLAFAKEYKSESDYIILAECVPAGTTTALCSALALGYDCAGKFSSSFKNHPNDVKQITIDKALSNINEKQSVFEKLSCVSDNMLIFNAGFVIGAMQRDLKIVLAGGTQMAGVLLVINSILRENSQKIDSKNLALCTTKWVYEDFHSDIEGLLKMLDFEINAYCSEFDFTSSQHPALKLYDDGEAKEGVGAGAALVYGRLNGLEDEQIVKKVESFLG